MIGKISKLFRRFEQLGYRRPRRRGESCYLFIASPERVTFHSIPTQKEGIYLKPYQETYQEVYLER